MPHFPPWIRRARRLAVAFLAFGAVAVDFHGDPLEYFCYFTILTNLGIGCWFLGAAGAPLRWEKRAGVRLALTIYGLVTLSVYWVLLAPIHHPQGWNYAANLILHLVVPLAMAFEDAIVPWPRTSVGMPLMTLVFPLVYCGFAVVRGELTGWYPYFFLNRNEVGGWGALAIYLGTLLVVFVVLAFLWRAVVHYRGKATAT